jgi:diguanylate cyclase (GGDEF)-like protein/PAS domain S-box-containing protein
VADPTDIINSLRLGVFQTDRDGRVLSANPSCSDLVASAGVSLTGAALWAHAHPGDRAAAELAWRRASDTAAPVTLSFRVWRPNGQSVWVRLDGTPTFDRAGRCTGYVGSATDETDVVHQRVLLDRLVGTVESSRDAVLILDRNGVPTYVNDAARDLFGIGEPGDLVSDPTSRGLMQVIRDQIPRELINSTESAQWTGEVGFRTPDGLQRTLRVDVVIQRNDDGTIDYWGGVARDVTEDKQLQDELARQATHDGLTGLPNRALFLRGTAAALDRGRATQATTALLFLDVDRLKEVNDSVGHDAGDELLTHVAARLSWATRPTDIVARIGGDEFVVLCDGSLDDTSALDLAERVRLSLSGRMMVRGIEVDLGVSIGVATHRPNTQPNLSAPDAAVALLRNADTAMYQAKRRGRSRCELFTEAMRAATRDHLELTNELELALAAGQLQLAYQPIISTHSGRVAGAEALLRWQHPTRGLLLPAQFVHLAEESGAIVSIGDWVLEQACQDTRAWLDSGLVERGFSVHVNVSERQMIEGTFVERVLASVRRYDLMPSQLTLDFDEAVMHEQATPITRSLQALRRFGIKLALDRFGTGPSSLTALRTCSADVLKLDGAIARSLGEHGDDDPLVRALIQLAHALDMQVVAEWVTSADQLHRLRMLGCDFVQGYLLGEPTAAERFALP